jgi:hypothetical protein
VAVHALDPYQTKVEYEDFIVQLNSLFKIRSSDIPKRHSEVSVDGFKSRTLIYYAIISILKRHHILIKVSEPYALTEAISDTYSQVHPLSDELKDFLTTYKSDAPSIAIHYRWGVGGKRIQKGESASRELDLNYYLGIVEAVKEANSGINYKLFIVTDAPEISLTFTPPKEQSSLWLGSPGFDDEQNSMHVSGISMKEQFAALGMDIEVISGGSPLVAIARLANADHLVMSRSSLSFVAALLSSSQVYFPSSFWHKPLHHWNVITDDVLH